EAPWTPICSTSLASLTCLLHQASASLASLLSASLCRALSWSLYSLSIRLSDAISSSLKLLIFASVSSIFSLLFLAFSDSSCCSSRFSRHVASFLCCCQLSRPSSSSLQHWTRPPSC
ncbi:hypothetical protein TorRG33x02_107850, partial [Trema orientale]